MPQKVFCVGLQVQRPAETWWRGNGARAGKARSPPPPLRLPHAVAPLTRAGVTQSPPQAGAEALAPGCARASSRGQDGMPAGLAPAGPTAPGISALAPWHVLFLPWPCGLDLCPCAHSEVPSIPPSPLSLVPTPSSDFYSFPPPPPPPRRHLISSPAPHSFPGFCDLCTHRLATPPPATAHTSPGFPPNPGD